MFDHLTLTAEHRLERTWMSCQHVKCTNGGHEDQFRFFLERGFSLIQHVRGLCSIQYIVTRAGPEEGGIFTNTIFGVKVSTQRWRKTRHTSWFFMSPLWLVGWLDDGNKTEPQSEEEIAYSPEWQWLPYNTIFQKLGCVVKVSVEPMCLEELQIRLNCFNFSGQYDPLSTLTCCTASFLIPDGLVQDLRDWQTIQERFTVAWWPDVNYCNETISDLF